MEPFLAMITPVQSPGQPQPPPGIWGPPGPWPTPPIHLPPVTPGQPPLGIWGPPGPWPTPPIHLPPGQPPLGIWGPPGPWPTPPIHLPPGGPGLPPLGIWGPPGPWPTPPIYLPPGSEIPPPEEGKMYVVINIPGYGWKIIQIPIPVIPPPYNPPVGGNVPQPIDEEKKGRREL